MVMLTNEEAAEINVRSLEGVINDLCQLLRHLEADDIESEDLANWADELDTAASFIKEVARDCCFAENKAIARTTNDSLEDEDEEL